MKVYLIAEVYDEDFDILGAFTSEEDAKEFNKLHDYYYDIKEVEIDALKKPDWKLTDKLYKVIMNLDGDVYSVSQESRYKLKYDWVFEVDCLYQNNTDSRYYDYYKNTQEALLIMTEDERDNLLLDYRFHCVASNEEEAIEKANKKRLEMIASDKNLLRTYKDYRDKYYPVNKEIELKGPRGVTGSTGCFGTMQNKEE